MKRAVILVIIFAIGVAASPLFAAPQTFTERLHQDWQFQDGGMNVPKVLAELGEKAKPFQERLTALEKENVPQDDDRRQQLYFDACTERRKQRLQFVRQTYPAIVYAKHQVLGGSHYSYTEAPSDAQRPEQRDMLGGKLLSLSIKEDGTVSEKILVDAPQGGTLRDPSVSFDGKKIVFSMRKSYTEDDYHLYDYNIADGAIRQLTFGTGFADIEPCCLPDGNIVFASTRCMQIVDCWWTDVSNLYCCDRDGRFMRRFGFDQVHTNYPQVLNDGRVIYTRWDYNDRTQVYQHSLFSMNYDGTGQTEYYGNNSWFPNSLLHAREIPNSNKVVAVASGHHTHQRGKLILIDRAKGTQENQGAALIAPVRETKAEIIDQYGQSGDQFQYPLPLDEENFIVAYLPEGVQRQPIKSGKYEDGWKYSGAPFGIYYMDINNSKRELLAWDASVSCGQPVPVQEREVPMLRASSVDYGRDTGLYYVQNVYFGPGLQGIERGTVKELRVVALEFRAAGIEYNMNKYIDPAHPNVNLAALVSTPVSIDNGSWDVKRVLGTVPVEADGSAFFEVPARTPLYFQLLNDRGETVQTMRSWSTLQPGERQNCFGCHEDKNATKNNPLSRGGAMRTLALRKAPKKPVPLEDVDPNSGFSYKKSVQPILDKHCISCHNSKAAADTVKASVKSLESTVVPFRGASNQLLRYSESYLNLTNNGQANETVRWLNVQSVPSMLPPYFAGSAKSKLVRMFDTGSRSELHKDVQLSDSERRILALWIDLLVPYRGSYTEERNWSPQQQAEYAYYQMKRDKMAAIERENVNKYKAWITGEMELPAPESFRQFDSGGIQAKRLFIKERLKK
ncbi:MAG: hypothetical protein LBT89_03580 [Planctomycetaceae bacterium]|jgi:hypothetical protein|nr:hypothetical protein [Planctomycetaceae bacterium]